jgi:ABC-type glutathione transport system ATPase component
VLLISHDLPLVSRVCDRVVVVDDGRLTAELGPAHGTGTGTGTG